MNENEEIKSQSGQGEGEDEITSERVGSTAEAPYEQEMEDSGEASQEYPGMEKKGCVEKDELQEKLDQQKKETQEAEIESENDKKLSERLKKSNEDLHKMLKDLNEVLGKYEKEYEKLKDQKDCFEKNNQSRLEEIPPDTKKEISDLIGQVDGNIQNLKTCRDNLECLSEKNGRCDDANYRPSEKKPDVNLECVSDDISSLMTLKKASDQLELSKKFHKSKEEEFNEIRDPIKGILDNLKKVKDYQDKANQEREAGNKCKEYALRLLIQDCLNKTKIVEPDEMGENLKDVLEELRVTKIDMCMREYVKSKVISTSDLVKTNLEEANKNRDQDILGKIAKTKK